MFAAWLSRALLKSTEIMQCTATPLPGLGSLLLLLSPGFLLHCTLNFLIDLIESDSHGLYFYILSDHSWLYLLEQFRSVPCSRVQPNLAFEPMGSVLQSQHHTTHTSIFTKRKKSDISKTLGG